MVVIADIYTHSDKAMNLVAKMGTSLQRIYAFSHVLASTMTNHILEAERQRLSVKVTSVLISVAHRAMKSLMVRVELGMWYISKAVQRASARQFFLTKEVAYI